MPYTNSLSKYLVARLVNALAVYQPLHKGSPAPIEASETCSWKKMENKRRMKLLASLEEDGLVWSYAQ